MTIDEDWRDAFGGVALRLAVFYFIGGVLMGGGFVAYLLFRDNLPNPQLAPLMIAVPAMIQLYLYARFSFVISAAAVGAPYTFGDRMRATGGITVLVLGLNLAFSLPLVMGQLALQTSASSAPTFGLVYFGTMLLTQVLFLLRVAVFTIINLVCFVNRTGWAPERGPVWFVPAELRKPKSNPFAALGEAAHQALSRTGSSLGTHLDWLEPDASGSGSALIAANARCSRERSPPSRASSSASSTSSRANAV